MREEGAEQRPVENVGHHARYWLAHTILCMKANSSRPNE
jgi:hypothetical protein